MDIEALAKEAVDCGYKIHRDLGPGLLESVYEGILARSLEKRGLRVVRQFPISFVYDGVTYDDGFRADILIEDQLHLLAPAQLTAWLADEFRRFNLQRGCSADSEFTGGFVRCAIQEMTPTKKRR